MSKIWVSPSGKTIQGHVLDCARGPLEAKLREYDAQLYVKWNPRKLQGWGCWEVRRRPENKKIKAYATYQGITILHLDYVENDFESHILDVPFLNYKILEKLKEIDTWQQSYKAKNFAHELEYKEDKVQAEIKEKAIKEKEYMIKQHKSMVRDLMEYVNSGGNPYRIADYWK